MGDFVREFQHSSRSLENSVSALSYSESNISSWDSLLKEAASSAQVYLSDNEESLSESSVDETNYMRDYAQSFVPLNLFQDSCSLNLSKLPSHRETLENLQDKIGYQINYFSLESETEFNEVKLICKLCCKTLHIAKVEEHVFDQEHLHNLVERSNSKISDKTAATKKNPKLKTSKISKFSKNISKCSNREAAERNVNKDASKKVVQDLTVKLKDYMNYFELHETKWSKPCFTCKMCRMSFPSKNARLHIYSNAHLRNLRRSLSVAKLEASEARNKKLVNDLISRFNNRLYFFQLIKDNDLNELYFICKVCTLVLLPERLESHIYASEHSENLQENPVVLNFDSLNNHNKQLVRELKNAIQIHKIKDFTFVYRVGTEELRFYCKCCQLTLIPENVKDHVKTSEHLRSAKVVETSLKSQTFEVEAMNSVTVTPKTVYSSSQVKPLSESGNENLTIVGFYSLNPTNKAIVKMLEDELESELMYFDLLQAIDTHELYFRCTLCDITLKPSLVSGHVMCSGHMKTWELNVHFEEFLSLGESSKKILRKLFFEVGSKLNAFCLAPDVGDRGLRFTCKFCSITLSSDIVVSHLQTKKHKSRTKEDDSEDCTATVSKDLTHLYGSNKYLSSEPNSHQIVEISDPPSVSHLSSASSGSQCVTPDLNFEEVFRENGSRTSRSNGHHQSESNENCFFCHNCSTTIRFKPAENNGLHKATAERFFINCCGKSVKASDLKAGKNHGVSKSKALDRKTLLSTLDDCNIYGFGSNGTHPHSNVAAARENSVESEAGTLCDSDKEILKSLIDKIGIKVNDFDYMFTASSNKLRVKCKFCSVMMRLESVEDHVNCESHVAYTQLSNISSLSFKALNDRNKKIVRKLYNKIGSEINDFDVKVKVDFVCKICNAIVCAETIPDHLRSEEHLKLLSCRSQNITAKSSQDSSDGSYETVEKMTQETGSGTSTHFPPSVDPCYDVLNFWSSSSPRDTRTHPEFESSIPNPCVSGQNKYFSSEDKTMKRTTFEETMKTSSIVTDLTNTAASAKFQDESEDFNSIFSGKPAESNYCYEKILQNLLVSQQDKVTSVVATNEHSDDVRGLLGSNNDFRCVEEAQNNILTTGVLCSEVNSMAQNSLPPDGIDSSRIKVVSDQITQKAHTASGNFQVSSKVSNRVLSSKPTANSYDHKTFKQIPFISSFGEEFSPTVVSNEKSQAPVRPSESNELAFATKVQKNVLSVAAHDAHRFPEFKSTIKNPISGVFNDKSSQCSSNADLRLTCAACLDLLQTNIEDIANHVNSEDHKTKLNQLPANSNFTNLSEKIVEVFTGEINLRVNNFDILYEIPQKELCFYCKLCHIIMGAAALERHVNHVHLNNLSEESANNEIKHSGFNIEERNQVPKLFLCQVCNFKAYEKDVTQHLKSERHLQLVKIRGDSVRFQSFSAYKGKVISLLCCDPFIKASDFEFLFETGSTKLYLYCKPCKVLLWPESLLNHLKTISTHSKDARVSTSSNQTSENSPKCTVM